MLEVVIRTKMLKLPLLFYVNEFNWMIKMTWIMIMAVVIVIKLMVNIYKNIDYDDDNDDDDIHNSDVGKMTCPLFMRYKSVERFIPITPEPSSVILSYGYI